MTGGKIVNDKATTGYGELKSLTTIIEGKECVDDIYKCLYFEEYSTFLFSKKLLDRKL